jgi:hypothetical protein
VLARSERRRKIVIWLRVGSLAFLAVGAVFTGLARGGAALAALAPILGLGLGGLLIWATLRRNRTEAARALPGDLFRGLGAINLDQLGRCPVFAQQLGSLASGLVGRKAFESAGVVVIRPEKLLWEPGTRLRHKGAPVISVPWQVVGEASVYKSPAIADAARLKLIFSDGSRVAIRVRGFAEARHALEEVGLAKHQATSPEAGPALPA